MTVSHKGEAVHLEISPPLARITLNSPSKGNALSPPLQTLLLAHLRRVAADPHVHFVVLTGTGKFFCTGMDLGSAGGAAEGGASGSAKEEEDLSLFEKGRRFFEEVERFPKPSELQGGMVARRAQLPISTDHLVPCSLPASAVIAVANGPCYGGGVGLFFLADIRICSPSLSFTLSEVKRGLVPALISPTIIREWGVALARDAMVSARPVSAAELGRIGAVRLFGDGSDGSAELREACDQLRRCGPRAMGTSKSLVRTQAATSLTLQSSRLGPPRAAPIEEARRTLHAAFEDMMRPSEEALEGIMKFRSSKGKEDVDWLEFYKSNAPSNDSDPKARL